MNTTRRFAIFALLVLACFSADARNYLFFNQMPLAMITGKGKFSQFDIGVLDNDGRHYVIDKRISKKIKTLWSYSEDGKPKRVAVTVKEISTGCENSLAVVAKNEEDSGGLLSLKPLQISKSAFHNKASAQLYRQGRKLLSSALLRATVSPKWAAQIAKESKVTPVSIFLNKGVSLVITASAESKNRSASAFLIASPDDRGEYVLRKEDVRLGGASDSESYAGTVDLVLHADLNGDGIEELLISQSVYESYGVRLLQWNSNEWIDVGGSGGGC